MHDSPSNQMEVTAPGRLGLMRQTLRERLIERKNSAEEHLADVTKALEFLDTNPAFESFHNLIGKTGF